MSKKMVLMAFLTLAFSANSFAAINKMEATKRLNAEHATEVKTAESFKEAFEKAKGDMSKLTPAQKREFNQAIAVVASKVGIETTALQRVFLRKSDILADVIRLEDALRSGTDVQKEAARTQIDLITLVGKAMDATNYNSDQAKAAIKLLQLDLTTLPTMATTVVKSVNEKIRSGKSLVDAVKEGTSGMKGSLEDLINCV